MGDEAVRLGEIGEVSAIERLVARLAPGSDVVVGIGDDCAVVREAGQSGSDLVLTSDPVIDGVHFDQAAAPYDIGVKAVGRVLSDIAAMGASPRWLLVNVAAPSDCEIERIEAIYDGMGAMAAAAGASIVGGDMAEAPTLALHLFGVGLVPRGQALLRSGATAGDHLFVTGRLGGSLLGRHLAVEPRLAEGAFLREWASAMMDVSDGIATDLRHLATMSGVGFHLDAAAIPVAPAAHAMGSGHSPLHHALHDGEDFELLFTVPVARVESFMQAWRAAFDLPVACIGEATATAEEIECHHADGTRVPLEGRGYAHFKGHPSKDE
jgi:thiamine-monophosphate kinase